MDKKPYHHLPDGTFRNPEGSPVRTNKVSFSYRSFKKKTNEVDKNVPKEREYIPLQDSHIMPAAFHLTKFYIWYATQIFLAKHGRGRF